MISTAPDLQADAKPRALPRWVTAPFIRARLLLPLGADQAAHMVAFLRAVLIQCPGAQQRYEYLQKAFANDAAPVRQELAGRLPQRAFPLPDTSPKLSKAERRAYRRLVGRATWKPLPKRLETQMAALCNTTEIWAFGVDYLSDSQWARRTLVVMLLLDTLRTTLDIDPLKIDAWRAQHSELWRVTYEPQERTSRKDRRQGHKNRVDMAAAGFVSMDDPSLLNQARGYVRARLILKSDAEFVREHEGPGATEYDVANWRRRFAVFDAALGVPRRGPGRPKIRESGPRPDSNV